jgi:hypothetical protein
MKPQIPVAFAHFWPGFTPGLFRRFFPYVYEKYDLVPSQTPQVVFYSLFTPQYRGYCEPRDVNTMPRLRPGNYVRVFLTGENCEPVMSECDYAMSFSALVDHPNHLALPLWVYENSAWGWGADKLIRPAATDWERVAAEKTEFCNFVYAHQMPFRDAIFASLSHYKRVDSAGPHLNNMNGWRVPDQPHRLVGKLDFLRHYKFTLALENMIWPGYQTEKLPDPFYVNSIPIYVGDPLARGTFDSNAYIDFTSFASIREMLEFVRQVDNDRNLYLKMLATPCFRNNAIPDVARQETILAFFDRIFSEPS